MALSTVDDRPTGTQPAWLADELRSVVHELASFERPSASEGERRAAELLARYMRDTPENLDWATMERAFAVTDQFVRAGAARSSSVTPVSTRSGLTTRARAIHC